MIVLEGEILMHLDGSEHVVGAGGIASAPRGMPHAFLVTGATGARVLCLHTPGCCQAFYLDAGGPATADTDLDRVDMAMVRASAERNGGIQILGPPPFAAAAS
jgi:hypothetical protein